MNPIDLARKIEERYRRYLQTTFYFKDPDLRRSFHEELAKSGLSKGPYLEATPVFKRGRLPKEVFREILGRDPEEAFLKALLADRPLYWHQEEAIRKVSKGRNVVVATGTGSGKTEAFLYPILLHLHLEYQENELGPGVRALILYPMNALANDQRQRLGEICKQLKENGSGFHFTFGQYIGETPEDQNDSKRDARNLLARGEREDYSIIRNGQVVHGEQVLRSEMREAPPHILLTNYSMLEYLLLRPDDSPLFDNGRARWWTFLVLDEAHQYRGTRGIEVAMLIRRLKQRLREGGRTGDFRCIATSATLMGGEQDRAMVAEFASELFGEPFTEEDVILGETEPIPEPSESRFTWDDYKIIREALVSGGGQTAQAIEGLAAKVGVVMQVGEDAEHTVGRLLRRDRRSWELRSSIADGPVHVQELASRVFADLPEENDRVEALSLLVELLLKAKDPETGTPLLSARYHLFLKSLEGAFVIYVPQKRVLLERGTAKDGTAVFEVALCRECGQHYFVGRIHNGEFVEAIRDPNSLDFGVTFLRPLEKEDDEEDIAAKGKEEYRLCLQCGKIRKGGKPDCDHNRLIRVVREEPPKDEDRADQIGRCGACGYSAAGRDPVREVIYGADGPHAVIATTLYQDLPKDRRKVLAFADSRQEAAFFAWYLEDSYKDILSRNLILKAAKQLGPYSHSGLSLQDLAHALRDIYREKEIMQSTASDLGRKREAWRALYREFLTDEPRISLEGVGLVRWSIQWPKGLEAKALLEPPWSLTDEEALNLMLLLLNTMRGDRAVEIRTEEGVLLRWDDLGLQAAQMRFRIGDPKGKKDLRSWDGKQGKRARFLAKLLVKNGYSEEQALEHACEVLREIWDAIRRCDEKLSSNDRLLLAVDDARRLNPNWWRLHLVENTDTIYQCDICGRLQTVSVKDICSRHGCPGTLQRRRVSELEPNHYRLLYEEELPGKLRVEEHTAQLDHDKAREFQREFRDGKIHVLSCSTTFELGVDLGDLDTVFLRNVPPEAFNYAQRVGRSGRRSGHVGFAITYCRRSPHDLYHFADPDRMLKGKTRPPVLQVCNEKIVARHMTAVALSAFFKTFPERFASVETFFKDLQAPFARSDLEKFLREQHASLEQTLKRIVPERLHDKVGLHDGSWIARICAPESRFALAEAEISSDYSNVKSLEKACADKGDYDTAKWARVRAQTIAGEDVLSFLSRKAVIPKYGFPVDVVELDTQRTQQNKETSEVLLQRDLSIAVAEFAPTSRLVANKKEWTSHGLKKVAEKEWPRRFYKRCSRHNVFLQWEPGQQEPPHNCGCPLTSTEYIVPMFGFVTSRDGPKNPKGRAPRVFTTRPYFAGLVGGHEPESIVLPADSHPVLRLKKASPGQMVVLCEGRRGAGFYICNECGAGFRKREKQHKTAYGSECKGTLKQVSLGHEFVTDVLQLEFLPTPAQGTDFIWFAYSLGCALLEGTAEVLEVPSTDLNVTVGYSQPERLPPIVLYDNVPGGAGLVARLEDRVILKECLQAAVERVSGKCGCADSTSCYGCLRSYRNQFAHQNLQRGPARAYMAEILKQMNR